MTVCVRDRSCILWRPDAQNGRTLFAPTPSQILSVAGMAVDACVQAIPSIYGHVRVEHYAIMPNHIHLLLSFDNTRAGAVTDRPTADLSRIIKQFKGAVTKRTGGAPMAKGIL